MATNDRASLALRAQEIINAHPEGMTTTQAVEQALIERYRDDPAGLAKFAASVTASSLSGLRKNTYELPDDTQGALFNPPEVIGIRTDDGDLLMTRKAASLGHIRQWVSEALSHHSTQRLRFKRADSDLDLVKDEPNALPWEQARALMAAIEQGEADGDGGQK